MLLGKHRKTLQSRAIKTVSLLSSEMKIGEK